MSRLPGWEYAGPEPDGFMTAGEFVDHLTGYARSFDAPVRPHTLVTRVERTAAGFAVHTDQGAWAARNVVIATGYHSRAKIPALAAGLRPASGPDHRRRATGRRRACPTAGVLVVGASASGVQIAHELAHAGRRVVLAVGGHTRLPRRYRGRDILWWLDRIGTLDRTIDQMPDADGGQGRAVAAAGRHTGRARGRPRRPAGRPGSGSPAGCARSTVPSPGSPTTWPTPSARRSGGSTGVLGEIDRYAAASPGSAAAPPDPPPAIAVPAVPSRLDLRRAGISAVVWATGYRPWYPWLAVPVLDGDGRIRHRRGVTDVPGLYAIGLRFQHRRNSTFIDGARHDAAYLADRIAAARAARVGGVTAWRRPAYDVIVVGARVAGAATAMLLARHGTAGTAGGPRPVRHGHAVHARAHARRRPAAVPVGPARPDRRGRHAAGPRRPGSTTATTT